MIIKVLGSGCANCHQTKKIATEVINEMGLEGTVEEVTDLQQIMSYGVMSTPGIVVDEKLMGSGGVPTKAQMEQLIKKAMS